MDIKNKVKSLCGIIRCLQYGIKHNHGIYIGRNASFKGGKNIHLGEDTVVRPYVDMWCLNGKINIGKGTEIGERCRISISNSLEIGDYSLLSPNIYITDCDHSYEKIGIPIISQGIINEPNSVKIGENTYIGINSVIVGNITIGKGSVVGANSVVTKDVPDYCVVVGSPAKIIKKYNFNVGKWERA